MTQWFEPSKFSLMVFNSTRREHNVSHIRMATKNEKQGPINDVRNHMERNE